MSVIIMTSRRQQQAWQFEQAILVSDIFLIMVGMRINNSDNCAVYSMLVVFEIRKDTLKIFPGNLSLMV